MRIILFGSGQGGRMAARWLPSEWELLAFADNNLQKQGTFLDGVPVIDPSNIPKLAPDLVWITLINRQAASTVKKQLEEMGYSGRVQVLDPFRETVDLRLACARLLAEEIHGAGLPGAVAELGVYQGAFAAELNRLFPDRPLYLFDTFSGFPEADIKTEQLLYPSTGASVGNFQDTSVCLVKKRLPHPEKAIFFEGRFPDTLPADLPPLVFVSLDPDLYEPVLSGLRAFWPKLVPSGVILVHDYNSFQFEGVKKAVRRFCREESLPILPLADLHGSAVLVKQK